MDGKGSVKRNYIYNLIYQIVAIIMPVITVPYLSRVLGAENIGIYSYTISITTYFILIGSLGITLYGQREIAFIQDDIEKRTKTFWEIFLLRMITMSISILFFYLFFIKNGEYSKYYAILIVELIGNIFDISWFFQGLEEFKKTISRNLIVKLISIISIFIFVKTKEDLNNYLYIYVLSILIGNFSLWPYLKKQVCSVKLKELKILRHLKPNLSLFIPQIAVQVYTVLDRTMIGNIIIDKSEVGFYDQSQKIIRMVLTVITAMQTVMLPRIASTYIKGEKEQLKQYMNKCFNFVYFLALPMIFGIIAISNQFVPIFFGDGYEKVSILMKITSPIILAIGFSTFIGGQYLISTKREKIFSISVIGGAITNFIMNMILIPKYGAIGAAIGTVMAESIVTLIEIIYVRKEFSPIFLLKISKNYFLASIVMYAVCKLIQIININPIISIFIQVIVGTSVYILMLLWMKETMIVEILEKIKNNKYVIRGGKK